MNGNQGERVWSDLQQAIFENVRSGEGHTIVVARAGVGKTTTLVESLRHLPPRTRAVMFAFNKAIAKELEERAPEGVSVSTLHSYGSRILYRAFGKLPLVTNKSLDLVGEKIPVAKTTWELRHAVARAVSLAKGCMAETPEEIEALVDAFGIEEAHQNLPFFVEVVEHVLKRTKERGDDGKLKVRAIDFDDMIWLPIALGLTFPTFDRVFVDETQDLNAAQLEMVLRACRENGRILAIGDDKQAIYRFRGADEDAIARMIARLSAKTLPLSVTYRCARRIVDVVAPYVPELTAYEGNPTGEVSSIDEAAMMRLIRPGDFLLSRTNAPLVRICLDLVREGRRANIQGRDLGAALAQIVHRSKAADVPALLVYVEAWQAAEIERLEKRDRETDVVTDKAACLRALAEGAESVQALLARIEDLFADREDGTQIVLSTTHKAKGLERDRVFMLRDTYLRARWARGREPEPPNQEEKNLFYVACTRARNELFFVFSPSSA